MILPVWQIEQDDSSISSPTISSSAAPTLAPTSAQVGPCTAESPLRICWAMGLRTVCVDYL